MSAKGTNFRDAVETQRKREESAVPTPNFTKPAAPVVDESKLPQWKRDALAAEAAFKKAAEDAKRALEQKRLLKEQKAEEEAAKRAEEKRRAEQEAARKKADEEAAAAKRAAEEKKRAEQVAAKQAADEAAAHKKAEKDAAAAKRSFPLGLDFIPPAARMYEFTSAITRIPVVLTDTGSRCWV